MFAYASKLEVQIVIQVLLLLSCVNQIAIEVGLGNLIGLQIHHGLLIFSIASLIEAFSKIDKLNETHGETSVKESEN